MEGTLRNVRRKGTGEGFLGKLKESSHGLLLRSQSDDGLVEE